MSRERTPVRGQAAEQVMLRANRLEPPPTGLSAVTVAFLCGSVGIVEGSVDRTASQAFWHLPRLEASLLDGACDLCARLWSWVKRLGPGTSFTEWTLKAGERVSWAAPVSHGEDC